MRVIVNIIKRIEMNKQKISLILLIIFLITVSLTIANTLLDDSNSVDAKNGTITINNKKVN